MLSHDASLREHRRLAAPPLPAPGAHQSVLELVRARQWHKTKSATAAATETLRRTGGRRDAQLESPRGERRYPRAIAAGNALAAWGPPQITFTRGGNCPIADAYAAEEGSAATATAAAVLASASLSDLTSGKVSLTSFTTTTPLARGACRQQPSASHQQRPQTHAPVAHLDKAPQSDAVGSVKNEVDDGDSASTSRSARLRRFLARRRAMRDVFTAWDTKAASAAADDFSAPSLLAATIERGVSLKRHHGTAAAAVNTGVPHPWQTLTYLGASNFNDAPLPTFMTSLSLLCPRRTVAAHAAAAAATSAAGGADRRPAGVGVLHPCSVHVCDYEATQFRVEAPGPDWRSPIQALVDALGHRGATSVFDVTPLLDDNNDEEVERESCLGDGGDGFADANDESISSTASTDGVSPRPLSFGELLPTACVPSAVTRAPIWDPDHDLDSSHSTRRGGSPRPVAIAADTLLAASTTDAPEIDSTLVATRVLQQKAVRTRPNVDRWRRYSTAVALYLCLAQAGACDADSLPFLAVQLLPPQHLLASADVRLELRVVAATARVLGQASPTSQLARAREAVPVAVTLPMARKGVVKRLPNTSTRPEAASAYAVPSIATEPFTDAEVFQLFYLQLVLRAFFDMRHPGMTWQPAAAAAPPPRTKCTATASGEFCGYFRSDRVGVSPLRQGEGGLAFEHPHQPDSWVFFRSHTRVLCILDTAHAVIPLYASPHELQTTACLPLFGSTGDLPCLTPFGYSVADWASRLEVDSPRAAYRALGELFDRFAPRYGCTRAGVWRVEGPPPRVLRCGERAMMPAMRAAYSGRLTRFLVPEEARDMVGSGGGGRIPQHLTPGETPLFTSAAGPLSQRPSALAEFLAAVAEVTAVAGGSETASVQLEQSRTMRLNASFSVLEPPPLFAESSGAATAASTDKVGAASCSARGTPVPTHDLTLVPVNMEATGKAVSKSSARGDEMDDSKLAITVGATSPFTKQESLVTRWRYYTREGLISVFDGVTTGMELQGLLGRGGSGLVYRGCYGRRRLPVAVKIFVIPKSMDHEAYVRESLTDVAFFVLMNQLDDYGICSACRAHDFIVSPVPPKGLPEADATLARSGRDPETTHLCYLVTDLMDGTLGRFLTESDDDFDPCYDTLLNSPLRAGELFQLLFAQLAVKAMFDWRMLDMMLNSQLRGDNIGFRYVSLSPEQRARMEADPEVLTETLLARSYYKGIIVVFQNSPDEAPRYLRFPGEMSGRDAELGPLRFIHFIDLGQGIQPNVRELTVRRLIGETVLDSCVEDDGFGRYWPLDELYCRYVEVTGSFAEDVVAWGSQVRVRTQDDAAQAMRDLLDLYYPIFGIPAPSKEDLMSNMLFTWSPSTVAELKRAYIYRSDPL